MIFFGGYATGYTNNNVVGVYLKMDPLPNQITRLMWKMMIVDSGSGDALFLDSPIVEIKHTIVGPLTIILICFAAFLGLTRLKP